MLLVADVGNTNIKLGLFDKDNLIMRAGVSTDRTKTEDEYAVLFSNIFRLRNVDLKNIDGIALSCVVPSISYQIKKALQTLSGKPVLEVGSNTNTGLSITIDDPSTLGADLAVSCVACKAYYKTPCIIINLGTATTFSVLNKKEEMCGGIIMPGVSVSLHALTDISSLLPSVGFYKPKRVIGTNTVDCLNSGSIYGTVAMIEGMCKKIEAEIGEKCSVIVTGGLSSVIVPYCEREVILDRDLIMKGLKVIYELNSTDSSK